MSTLRCIVNGIIFELLQQQLIVGENKLWKLNFHHA